MISEILALPSLIIRTNLVAHWRITNGFVQLLIRIPAMPVRPTIFLYFALHELDSFFA